MTLPDKVGLKITDVPQAIERGKVKALMVFGENPLMSDPDAGSLRKEVEKLDFLVVLDPFMTETCASRTLFFRRRAGRRRTALTPTPSAG